VTRSVPRIHSLPDDAPWAGGLPPAGSAEHPLAVRALDSALALQRPAVIAHLRSIRLRHRQATTLQIVATLERRYLSAVTTSGAAVGATAVVPGVGTGVTLALSGAETVAFLEATALLAQSVAEVHGIAVSDPDRARALVLTILLGREGVDLVTQLSRQLSGRGPGREQYWGEIVTRTLPRAALAPLLDRLTTTFLHRFAVRGGASWLGKAMPFGVGAAIGGTGNHLLGRRVVAAARDAFGMPPQALPAELEPGPDARKIGERTWSGAGRAGAAVAGAARAGAAGASRIFRRR
jgi:hypothetical protein